MHRTAFSLILAVAVFAVANAEEKFIGKFTNYHHGIAGEVYAADEQTLKIKGFEYDGAGPDAFFWAGTSGEPSKVGIILPFPFDGKFYDYEDSSAPVLGRFEGADLTLHLPPGTQVSDLKWLSVWCRAFTVNFGDLIADFTLGAGEGSEAEAESESEPETTDGESDDIDAHHPPLVSPENNNAHDPHHRHHDHDHHDHDHKHDADAEAEAEGYAGAEGEAESEAEAEAAYGTGSEKRPVGFAIALSALIALALW